MTERIVALIDMDCFYCQVEARINPELMGKPMAVVQYNTWKGGGIIAVNYEARNFGVTRHLRGNEARKKCPTITLVQVPELRGKADLTKYRDAGREVVNVLVQFSDCVERASVDEAYVDLTQAVEKYITNMKETVTIGQLPNTFVVGFSEDQNNDEDLRIEGLSSWLSEQMQDPLRLKLAVAGVIVEEIRAAVFTQTQFRCSAGIGHNKVLAKLVCCLHKPNRQTLLPQEQVAELFRTLPVRKVRHLGGKLGETVTEQLGCKFMADLLKFTEPQLQSKFDAKTGSWLYNIARGLDSDPVTPRLLAKSIGCCKAFKGTQGLVSEAAVAKWMLDLSNELAERLGKEQEENKRVAKLLTVSFMLGETSSTRSGAFNSMEAERIAADGIELIRRSNADKWTTPIHYLGVSAGKFVDESRNSIQNFFKSVDKMPAAANESTERSKFSEPDTCVAKVEKSVSKSSNHSFFMKFFKQRSEAKVLEPVTDAGIESNPGTSSDCGTGHQNAPVKSAVTPIRPTEQPVAGCSKDVFNGEASNSNDSVNWTSLGEIFPDINSIDDSVAALLPLSMQKQLADRRQVVNKDEQGKVEKNLENKIDLEARTEISNNEENSASSTDEKSKKPDAAWNGFFSTQLKKRFSTSIYVEDHTSKFIVPSPSKPPAETVESHDMYHMDESTDVDESEDLVCESENPSIDTNSQASSDSSAPPVLRLAAPTANAQSQAGNSSENTPSTSDSDLSDIPGQLCKACSKRIPLNEYMEHLDFHAAEALHKELNRADSLPAVRTVTNTRSSVSKKSPVKAAPLGGRKRGRPSKSSMVAKSDEKRVRSITSFFAPNK